jgi:hypothetical protein
MNYFETFRNSDKFNKENYEFGVKQEIELLRSLQFHFHDNSIERLPEGHSFDYQGKNKIIELKTRRYEKSDFYDTAINLSKIEFSRNMTEKDVYFVFKFTDGVYFWKYDKTIKLRKGYLFGKEHYFIPVCFLGKILIVN